MIAKALHQQLLSANYYKLFLSKEYGGRGESIPDAMKIIRTLSQEDGDLGWMVAIGSGGNYFCGYLEESVAKIMFSSSEALVAGSGATTGIAKKVKGGWNVSGTWKYASGCKNATVFTFNCLIDNTAEKISIAVDPKDVTIIEDWNALGLKFSDTHTVSVKSLFVPDKHTFSIEVEKNITHPAQHYPFLEFAVLCFIPVIDGLSSKIINLSLDIFNQRDWNNENIEQLRSEQNSRWEKIMDMSRRSWDLHLLDRKDDELNALLIKLCVEHNHKCRLEITDLFGKLGMAVLDMDHSVNKCYCNLLTASQHALLKEY